MFCERGVRLRDGYCFMCTIMVQHVLYEYHHASVQTTQQQGSNYCIIAGSDIIVKMLHVVLQQKTANQICHELCLHNWIDGFEPWNIALHWIHEIQRVCPSENVLSSISASGTDWRAKKFVDFSEIHFFQWKNWQFCTVSRDPTNHNFELKWYA